MFHYLFTNDLRISTLDESLKKAGNCFVTNTVPSSAQDKSANNNMKTLGFYFNLTESSQCAREAKNGNVRGVVLNFIKKFQYPNLRTKESYEDVIKDKIQFAPMRMIIKVLYVMNLLFNKDDAFLSKNEIKYFLFYNEKVAKEQQPDMVRLVNTILEYRKTNALPTFISTDEKEHFWKHEDRQLREMIKILLWSGCICEKEEKIYISEEKLSRDNKADIYEIINYNEYWSGEDVESYQKYMDMPKHEHEDIDVRYLFELSNKEFAFECVKILNKYELLSEKNLEIMTNKQLSSQYFKNTFPILIDILIEEGNDGFEEQFRDAKGYSRYYAERVVINGNRYAITNNWYFGGEKDVDTRTPFVNWLVKEIKTKEGDEVKSLLDIVVTATPISVPYNYLLFGAPGTGKSFMLERLQKMHFTENNFERVTFYPNYSYQNFVGSYKPCMNKQEISYEYVPGPFIRVLLSSYKNPDQNFLLVIEELNRANAAAVFGDLFQLLDRKNGKSEYLLNTNEDLKRYMAKYFVPTFEEYSEEKQEIVLSNFEKIYIPSNMYIWATMNSADQGVFPMDTAFKRRWEFEYLSVDDAKQVKAIENYYIPMCLDDTYYVKWQDLRSAINNILTSDECKINEDKLLGPFFISKNMLEDIAQTKELREKIVSGEDTTTDIEKVRAKEKSFIKAFESKVIMYLFEDVMKMRPQKIFVGHEKNKGQMIFSAICDAFEKDGEKIFDINLKHADID